MEYVVQSVIFLESEFKKSVFWKWIHPGGATGHTRKAFKNLSLKNQFFENEFTPEGKLGTQEKLSMINI